MVGRRLRGLLGLGIFGAVSWALGMGTGATVWALAKRGVALELKSGGRTLDITNQGTP